MGTWSLTARWILPVARPPVKRGRIVIEEDRIVALEATGPADVDLGNVAILPGLVNAHVHLDLSGFRQPIAPGPEFPAWLQTVIAHRLGASPEQTNADIRSGLAESLRAGVTLLGDIAGTGLSAEVLGTAPLRAVVFYEVLGLSAERAEMARGRAEAWLRTHPPTETFRPGLSPHAPYSVRNSLYEACVGTVPLATHLAESADEMRLLQQREGPFVPFLQGLGVYDPAGLVTEVPALITDLARAPRLLLVHANHLDPETPLPGNVSIVYCPRTHAVFGHPPHPYRSFLERGVRVALGTDGRSSNPDLDILAEARWLAQVDPSLPGETLLRMLTQAGAEALGWGEVTGVLEPGKSADLVAVPLPEPEAEPHRLLFGGTSPVTRTLFRGKWRDANAG